MARNKRSGRGKRQKVVITSTEHVKRIETATAEYTALTLTVKEYALGIRECSGLMREFAPTAPKQEWQDALVLLEELSKANGIVSTSLAELEDVVKETPLYYPYSADKLLEWETVIGGTIVTKISNLITEVGTGLSSLTSQIEAWGEHVKDNAEQEEE